MRTRTSRHWPRSLAYPELGIAMFVSAAYSTVFIARSAFVVDDEAYFTLFDDAMISMRYARNLAEGYGLRWNAGEAPVEGYTNLLWTLWMAALHALQLPTSKVALAVMISSALILLAHVWLIHRIALNVSGGCRRTATLAVAFVSVYYPLVFWSLRGLEVGLQALITGAVVWQVVQLQRDFQRGRLVSIGVLLAAAVLSRPEAILMSLVVAVLVVRVAPRGARVMTTIALLLPVLAVCIGQTMFRLGYYGDVLPNTYYLKLTGTPLAERLQFGIRTLARVTAWHMLIPIAFVSIIWRRVLTNPALLLLALIFATQCTFSAYAGGDGWEWLNYANRYIAVGMPALLILAAHAIAQTLKRIDSASLRTPIAVVLGLMVIAQTTVPHVLDWLRLSRETVAGRVGGGEVDWDKARAGLGLALKAATPSAISLGVMSAGAIPYFSDRRAIDLLGKNDQVIAKGESHRPYHRGDDKWDYAYSIGVLQPDVVLQLSIEHDLSGEAALDAYARHLIVLTDTLEGVIYVKPDTGITSQELETGLTRVGWQLARSPQ